jgi:hypothetical protein
MAKRLDDPSDPLAGDWLWQAAEIKEQPFVSQVPVFGRLVAGCRTAWCWIADRAYLQPLRHGQSELNRALLGQMAELDQWLLVHDRETVQQSKDIALLSWRLRHLEGRLLRIGKATDEAGKNQGSN